MLFAITVLIMTEIIILQSLVNTREKESDMIHSLVQAAPSIISANGPVDPDFIALISLSYSFILPTPSTLTTPAPFPLHTTAQTTQQASSRQITIEYASQL